MNAPGMAPKAEADWPSDLDPRTICLSVDVEWAADAVLADLRQLLDERGLTATFFCTHPGIDVGMHERGLHPNFRANGDAMSAARRAARTDAPTEADLYRAVLDYTLGCAPEAKGVRSHSLHYDSALVPIYRQCGLEYDSSYMMPLVGGLRPFWKESGLLEIPIYFMDHIELLCGTREFRAAAIGLDGPGLKVFDLHPNIVFINAASEAQYAACKAFYGDHDRLLATRHAGRGIRTLVTDLLDEIVRRGLPTATLGDINARWRRVTAARA